MGEWPQSQQVNEVLCVALIYICQDLLVLQTTKCLQQILKKCLKYSNNKEGLPWFGSCLLVHSTDCNLSDRVPLLLQLFIEGIIEL